MMPRAHPEATLIIGSRGSQLARAQTQWVIDRIQGANPELQIRLEIITTTGDRQQTQPLPEIGGKGVFTEELERALAEGSIDLAVHSAKDLPTRLAEGLDILAVPVREDPRDAWICPHGKSFAETPAGSVIGTSSLRRQAQLRRHRPDLQFVTLRGNVDTRIRKVHEGQAYATILAMAGLKRVGLTEHVTHAFEPQILLPAPGQGTLALEGRADDQRVRGLLRTIHHSPSSLTLDCERLVVEAIDAGCRAPLGVYAQFIDSQLSCEALLSDPAGTTRISAKASGPHTEIARIAADVAQQLISGGAAAIIAACRK